MSIEWAGTLGFGSVTVYADENGKLTVDDEAMSKDFCMKVIKDAFDNLVEW